MIYVRSTSLSLGFQVLGNTSCCQQATPHSQQPASKLSRNALVESTVWKPSPETKHLRGDIITNRGNAKRLMITMISLPRRELGLVPWGDDNDTEGISCWHVGRGTGSFPEVVLGGEGRRKEMDEDMNHIHVIQIQQALQGGADSVDSCWEVVWSHHSQLVIRAHCKSGPRTTSSVQGCSGLNLPSSALGLRLSKVAVKDTPSGLGWLPAEEETVNVALSEGN